MNERVHLHFFLKIESILPTYNVPSQHENLLKAYFFVNHSVPQRHSIYIRVYIYIMLTELTILTVVLIPNIHSSYCNVQKSNSGQRVPSQARYHWAAPRGILIPFVAPYLCRPRSALQFAFTTILIDFLLTGYKGLNFFDPVLFYPYGNCIQIKL